MKKGWLPINRALRGFSLVEVILASSLFVFIITALVGALIYGGEGTLLSGLRARAALLADEGVEVLRNMKDEDFANLKEGTHGLAIAGNKWAFLGSQDTTEVFTRQVSVTPLDAARKQVSAGVSWLKPSRESGLVSLLTQMTDWKALAWWVSPAKEASVNLPGTDNALKIQIQGNYAYLVRDGGTSDFTILDISNPSSPLLLSSLNIPDGSMDIAFSGNYVFIASQDNASELSIIDVSNPSSPLPVGTYNAPGGANAHGIFIKGSALYLVRASLKNDEFLIIDISLPREPTLLGSLDLGATANDVVVMGNYAYVASSKDAQELQVIDITNPNSPVFLSSYNLSGTDNARSITALNTSIILGRENGEGYVIDVSIPLTPILSGSFNLEGSANDFSLGKEATYVYAATGAARKEFQVLDIQTPQTPFLVGALDLPGTQPFRGIAYDALKDRAFVVGEANGEEFLSIAPQ